MAGLQLADASPSESVALFSFCEEIGLPTTLAALGLRDIDLHRLMKAAEKVCAPEEAIHHEAGMITTEKAFNAMIAADALGQARRKPGTRGRSGMTPKCVQTLSWCVVTPGVMTPWVMTVRGKNVAA